MNPDRKKSLGYKCPRCGCVMHVMVSVLKEVTDMNMQIRCPNFLTSHCSFHGTLSEWTPAPEHDEYVL